MILSTLTASQLRLLEALAAHSRIILLGEYEAAEELLRRKLIERERRGSAIMRPTLGAMRELYLRERELRALATLALHEANRELCRSGMRAQ